MKEANKKVALKQMLVGKVRDNFDLWQAEKMSFEELLKKVKELARAKKLDTDASHGKAGVALGAQHAKGGAQEQGHPGFGSWTESPATEVNAFNRRWKSGR